MMTLEHRRVIRYVYGLILVVAMAMFAWLLISRHQYAIERGLREEIERYHLPSIMLTRAITEQLQVLSVLGAAPHGNFENQRDFDNATYIVNKNLQTLEKLRAVHGASEFLPAMKRLQTTYQVYLETETPSTRQRFGFRNEQLYRLHQTAIERALGKIDTVQQRSFFMLLTSAALIAGIAGLVALRLLYLIRLRLREQEEAERALRAGEERLQHGAKLQALGTFVGGVAHDFNNLLTVMLGNAERLLWTQGKTDPEIVAAIKEAGDRAARLVRELLTFSRQSPMKLIVVDLNEQLQKLEPMLSRLIRKDIELQITYGADSGNIEIDPDHLGQVLMNLATNAQDAMPDCLGSA